NVQMAGRPSHKNKEKLAREVQRHMKLLEWTRARQRRRWMDERRRRLKEKAGLTRRIVKIEENEARFEEQGEMAREHGHRLAELERRVGEIAECLDMEMGEERVTEEMVVEARRMREHEEREKSSARYIRTCLVCATENPRQRAVFTRCGHIVCYPCAVDNARSDATDGKCVFCRSMSGFVKIFEDQVVE
ncbi:hypothetical protein PMAYCL1PPCAC_11546, partial [Pristionchus mayeri]